MDTSHIAHVPRKSREESTESVSLVFPEATIKIECKGVPGISLKKYIRGVKKMGTMMRKT